MASIAQLRSSAMAELASSDARRAGSGELGQIRVAYSWSARFEIRPAVGRAFRASHPDGASVTEAMWMRTLPALSNPALRGAALPRARIRTSSSSGHLHLLEWQNVPEAVLRVDDGAHRTGL
jgi:hypothetical protein